jgi:nicotinate phosphoribosyltransferase
MIDYTATYTDQYQIAMGQVYFLKGHKDQRASFDYFFRRMPFKGGYAVFAGLEDLLDVIENLRFDAKDIDFLGKQHLHPDYIDYLKDFRFTGSIISSAEGDLVFPNRPILRVEGNIIEAQLVETLLLNMLNFQTLIATKASRIRTVADGGLLVDFGLRRAPGPGGYVATRAAIVGGFEGTSNVRAGRDYDIPVSGTMAHSFIQSYDDELSAFRAFAEARPEDCVLLVDTYSTLESGVPNAITVGLEMKKKGGHLKGIRLDSGDLAYLSKRARQMLDDAGLKEVKIAASNELDENVIRSLREQGARIDIYGVGTNLVTGKPDAVLDGVYKLAFSGGKPRIKISESTEKTTLPGKKQVFRVIDAHGHFFGADAIALDGETGVEAMHHHADPNKSISLQGLKTEPLLHAVMESGKRTHRKKPLKEIRDYSLSRLALLPEEYKRFDNPHIYKIGLSAKLRDERNRLIAEHKAR